MTESLMNTAKKKQLLQQLEQLDQRVVKDQRAQKRRRLQHD